MQNRNFQAEYHIEYLTNFAMITTQQDLPIAQLKRADLFIYQPLSEKQGIYATDHIRAYLKDACKQISFPYLYNDALWPLFHKGEKIINAKPILDLLAAGASVVDVALQFLRMRIDFQFETRFRTTMQKLEEKENFTDIKASAYILENYRDEKLFLTHNHPATPLLIHCANQLFTFLGCPLLDKKAYADPNAAGLPGYYPMSPYDKRYYHFTYAEDWRYHFTKKVKCNWRRVYLQRIMEVCLSRHEKKTIRSRYEKGSLKLLRSIVKYLPIST